MAFWKSEAQPRAGVGKQMWLRLFNVAVSRLVMSAQDRTLVLVIVKENLPIMPGSI